MATMASIKSPHPGSGVSLNFLHLPREIRDRIYEFVLVSHTGRVYMLPSLPQGSKDGRRIFFSDENRIYLSPKVEDGRYLPPKVTLNLLRTCRQIYAEACDIPYEKNIFKACESLSLDTLAEDMESFSFPLIERLEIVHCAA